MVVHHFSEARLGGLLSEGTEAKWKVVQMMAGHAEALSVAPMAY
jgi:hypothetical protein